MRLLLTIAFLSPFLLLAQSFQKAQLIAKDSILVPVEIQKKYVPVHGHNTNLYDVIKIREKTVFPNEIRGYTIGKKIFKSLEIKNGTSSLHIFAEQLQNGPVSLYYYNGLYFGQQDIYIFRKLGQQVFYISLEPKVKTEGLPTQSQGTGMPPDLIMAAQLHNMTQNWSDERVFKAQFMQYFSDCSAVVYKLKQDWYTSASISSLFQEYNTSCVDIK